MDTTGTSVLLRVVIEVAFLLIAVAALSVRIVPPWGQMVVYRWGQTNKGLVREPGLRFLVPMADKGVLVDLREQFIEVPRQTAITKDNAPLGVDFLIYWKIVEPLMSQINVKNFAGALQGVAATSLRSVIGDIPLDDVLSQREKINETLRLKLDPRLIDAAGNTAPVDINDERSLAPPGADK